MIASPVALPATTPGSEGPRAFRETGPFFFGSGHMDHAGNGRTMALATMKQGAYGFHVQGWASDAGPENPTLLNNVKVCAARVAFLQLHNLRILAVSITVTCLRHLPASLPHFLRLVDLCRRGKGHTRQEYVVRVGERIWKRASRNCIACGGPLQFPVCVARRKALWDEEPSEWLVWERCGRRQRLCPCNRGRNHPGGGFWPKDSCTTDH